MGHHHALMGSPHILLSELSWPCAAKPFKKIKWVDGLDLPYRARLIMIELTCGWLQRSPLPRHSGSCKCRKLTGAFTTSIQAPDTKHFRSPHFPDASKNYQDDTKFRQRASSPFSISKRHGPGYEDARTMHMDLKLWREKSRNLEHNGTSYI